MANGWDGSTPTQQDDGAGTVYELGQAITVNSDVTVTGVRVWHGASTNTVTNRSARVWTTGGVTVQAVLLDDTLPPGWSTFAFDEPLELTAGVDIVLSYSTRQFYGAVAGQLPNTSADGAISFTGGRFAESVGTFPTNVSTTFYGVDLSYELGIGGNQPPVPAISVAVDELEATATISVDDESPTTVGYRVAWGDGSTTVTDAEVVAHTYASPGLYAVSVLATDADGAVGVAAVPVLVRQPGRGIDVDAAIVEIAETLRSIDGLEVFDEIPGKIAKTPAAIVAWPESVMFDAGGRRSTDTLMIPIVVCLTRNVPRVGREQLGGFASGQGARSVKTVLEGGVYATIRGLIVKEALFDVVTIGAIEYIAVVLTADVKG